MGESMRHYGLLIVAVLVIVWFLSKRSGGASPYAIVSSSNTGATQALQTAAQLQLGLKQADVQQTLGLAQANVAMTQVQDSYQLGLAQQQTARQAAQLSAQTARLQAQQQTKQKQAQAQAQTNQGILGFLGGLVTTVGSVLMAVL